MQGAQINAIQNDLDGVAFKPKDFYLEDLTQQLTVRIIFFI